MLSAVPVNVADRDCARAEEVETAQGHARAGFDQGQRGNVGASRLRARLQQHNVQRPRPIFAMSAHCAHGEVERTIAVQVPQHAHRGPEVGIRAQRLEIAQRRGDVQPG